MENLILIPGLPRSGTTTIANILSQTPDISLGHQKEPHFFIERKGRFVFEGAVKRSADSLGLIESKNKYLSNFSSSSKWVIDASTLYTVNLESIEKIKDYGFEIVKCILIFRDAKTRAASHHTFSTNRDEEYRTFQQAIQDELDGKHKDWLIRGYLEGSKVKNFYDSFKKSFGEENILVLKLEDTDFYSQSFLVSLEKFLGVKINNPVKIYQNENRDFSNPVLKWVRSKLRKIRQISPELFDNKITRLLFEKFMNVIPKSQQTNTNIEISSFYDDIFKNIDIENQEIYLRNQNVHSDDASQ